MLEAVAAIGGGSFVLVSLAVGLRLLLVWWRTRELPEFALGFGLFAMGGVGYPLMVAAVHGFGLSVPVREALLALQIALNVVGITAMAVFTRRVFRPEAPAAKAAVAAVGLSLLSLAVWQAVSPGLWAFLTDRTGAWSSSALVVVAALAWSGVESLLYFAKLRRRVRLGLADPVVTQRFGFWGFSILTAAGISLAGHLLERAGVPTVESVIGALVVGPPGLVMSAALWMAFFPPAAYVRWVKARAAAA
jgi:hypothetical protein